MTKRAAIRFLVTGALFGALGVFGCAPDIPEQRSGDLNVVLISVDALRADHLGVYGYTRDTSPNIDELSRRSIVFRYAYVQWPKTSQSMASMLTGKYPRQTGVIKLTSKLATGNLTLAEILAARGYWCAGFVANGNLGMRLQYHQGFDEYHELWKGRASGGKRDSYAADGVNGELLPWLRANRERTFFLWVHYIDPHGPYTPKGEYRTKFYDPHKSGGGRLIPTRSIPPYQRLDEAGMVDIDYYIAQYDGEIGFMDAHVGGLLEELERSGLANETIVVLTADHGESLDDHDYFFEHGLDVFNPCLRVPLIIHHPGIGRGVVTQSVGLIDLVPTLLEMLGVDASGMNLEGKSLMPLISGSETEDRVVYSENAAYGSVVDGKRKLIGTIDGSAANLFNLGKDPEELKPLSEEKARDLREKLVNWHNRMAATSSGGEETIVDQSERSSATREQLKTLGYMQ